MNVAIAPSVAKGSVLAPPSKSMAHRALIAAALSEGESVLSPVALSEDMIATMESLSALGASFSRKGETVFVKGVSYPRPTGENLFCRESGSTLRFLIPLCLLTGERITLTGAPRLLERPLSVYEDLCREKGFLFEKTEESLTVCGRLCAGMYRVPGNISSQFITGLLFALSVLSEDSVLAIEGDLESASYLDMTSLAMSRFGKTVKREGKTFYLSGKSAYIPQKFTVEGDYSNAAFLEAFSLLGGEVCVSGLEKNSVQGDRVYRDFYPRLAKGCPTLDLSDCPDLAPVLFALAALFHGGVFTGTSRLAGIGDQKLHSFSPNFTSFLYSNIFSPLPRTFLKIC